MLVPRRQKFLPPTRRAKVAFALVLIQDSAYGMGEDRNWMSIVDHVRIQPSSFMSFRFIHAGYSASTRHWLATFAKCLKVADPAAILIAGTKKEVAYLNKYGQPLHPLQRLRREIYNYQKVSPSKHIHSLEKYLQAVPYIIPTNNAAITRPTLRHPDLQPNNIFVSDNLTITSLIN